jgi:hypothetical protein
LRARFVALLAQDGTWQKRCARTWLRQLTQCQCQPVLRLCCSVVVYLQHRGMRFIHDVCSDKSRRPAKLCTKDCGLHSIETSRILLSTSIASRHACSPMNGTQKFSCLWHWPLLQAGGVALALHTRGLGFAKRSPRRGRFMLLSRRRLNWIQCNGNGNGNCNEQGTLALCLTT